MDWSPDTFGHALTNPVYLSRGAVRWFYHIRSGQPDPYPGYAWVNNDRPAVFWWTAPDGSRVLALREIRTCSGSIVPDVIPTLLDFCGRTGLREMLHVYGVGDHGGGPVRRDILRSRELNTWPIFPRFVLSGVGPFFRLLEERGAKWPVVDTELNFEFSGCYSSVSILKKINRLAETQLQDAEAAASLAGVAAGVPYPAADFREAWQDALFSQFHDILPGTCIRESIMYSHGLYQKTAAMAGMAETLSLRGFAARVDTSAVAGPPLADVPASEVRSAMGAGVGFGAEQGGISGAQQGQGEGPRPFLVFNPSGFDRREVVTATIWDNDPNNPQWWGDSGRTARLGKATFCVRTSSGEFVPAQMIKQGNYWGHGYATLAFPADTVPGLGYGVHTVIETRGGGACSARHTDEHGRTQTDVAETCGPAECVAIFGRYGVENDFIRLDFDPATGNIRSMVDKASGVQLADPARPTGLLEFAYERPHGGSGWMVDETGPRIPITVTSVRRTLSGPNVAAIEVSARINESTITLTYELRAGEREIRVGINAMWLERGAGVAAGAMVNAAPGAAGRGVPVLRFALPLALENAAARYEIPFGAIGREQNSGQEVPALNWAQVTGRAGRKTAGCIVANYSKHGHSLDGDTLRVTLIRSTYDPDPLPEMGRHSVRLALRPFVGKATTADAYEVGFALNHPLRVVGTDVHEGALPATGRFLSLEPASLALCGVKRAESGEGIILRFTETDGKKTRARIRVDERLLGKLAGAVETDVLERPLENSTAKARGNDVTLNVAPFSLVTVLLRAE